tara:strand:- start:417 stop:737 length:321 start_codon:yes stop_codon:yes gene_type:complete
MYDFSNYERSEKPQKVPDESPDQKEADVEQPTKKVPLKNPDQKETYVEWTTKKAQPEDFQSQSIKHLDSLGKKLDKLYYVMNSIRWIGWSIGLMFIVTFMLPRCTG